MTSYMSKDQGNFDFSVHDPIKKIFLNWNQAEPKIKYTY